MTEKYSLSLVEHLPSIYLGEGKIRNEKVLKIYHVIDATIACCCCLVAKSCLTLCDPMDYSLPGSSVHGIFQARILEWVAMASSRGIFPTQGLNPGLLHSRQILYQLSYQGSPCELPFPSSHPPITVTVHS